MGQGDAVDIADAIRALHRAGWSIGDAACIGPDGARRWVVSGTNGENRIVAEGPTEAAAWRAVGMLGW